MYDKHRAPADTSAKALQDTFCARILPVIERHARVSLRHLRPEARDEATQEARALAWKYFLRLSARGRDATAFSTVFAEFAVRHVRAGRSINGQQRARDAMSRIAQQRHEFTVGKLPDYSTLTSNPLEQALIDDHITPPPDAAAFRCDFPTWLSTHSERDRAMVTDLGRGETTGNVAQKFRCSAGRISQKRREFADSWQRFHGGMAA